MSIRRQPFFERSITTTAVCCVVTAVCFLTACGRPRAPRPPEDYSPHAVSEVTVETTENTVVFNWVGPGTDQRGKELESMEGYKVYRQEISEGDQLEEPTLLGFVEDKRIEERDKKKAELRAEGRSGRRVKVKDQPSQFTFTDTAPTNGTRYLYKVIPTNQDGVEGEVGQLFDVLYKGKDSQVAAIDVPKDAVEASVITEIPTY